MFTAWSEIKYLATKELLSLPNMVIEVLKWHPNARRTVKSSFKGEKRTNFHWKRTFSASGASVEVVIEIALCMRVGISMGEEIDRRNQLNHSSLNLSQQSRPNVVKKRSSLENCQKTFVKIVRRSPLKIPKVVKKNCSSKVRFLTSGKVQFLMSGKVQFLTAEMTAGKVRFLTSKL